jgi:DNA-binding CsgD family transcriptional regulator
MEDFLIRLDEKLRQRNERLIKKLRAWGELLDAAGWCVALDCPGEGVWVSGNAERDLQRTGGVPATWLELMEGIPKESVHHSGDGVLVWSGSTMASAVLDLMGTLTRRESEVMSWLREGKTGHEIAIILGCATRTVEKHLANLYRKLGVTNRAAVILKVSNPTS